jgi:beta-glucuronidase
MQRDIDIIKKMNCNSIRGSHYPQSKIFLDMLDEQGITFWSEIPIWGSGFSAQALSNEVVISRGLKMHEEMLKQYYNHPSIIIWGLHNEILSSAPEGYEISKIYYDYVKKEDPSRLVVYATRLPLTDICYEFSDVICVNRYVGWYTNEIEDWDLFCEDLDEYLKSINQSHKAIIMSEFGSASIYGYSTFDDIRWTEEYQARLLSYMIDLFLNKKEYAGTYVWQFANIRTSKPDLNRARCYNNKGVVDEYRRPKMAFYAVKESYAKITDR